MKVLSLSTQTLWVSCLSIDGNLSRFVVCANQSTNLASSYLYTTNSIGTDIFGSNKCHRNHFAHFFPTEKYKIEEGQGSRVFSATFIFGTEKNEKVRETEYLMGFKLSDVKKFPIENLLSRGQG